MALFYKKLLKRLHNDIINGSRNKNLYGEKRELDIFIEELKTHPPKGFMAIYQDMGLCADVSEVIQFLEDKLNEKGLNFNDFPRNLKGLQQIFEQLKIHEQKVLWIVDRIDALYRKSRVKNFNWEFFENINAISKNNNISIVVVSKKPLGDIEYFNIEERRWDASPIAFPAERVGRISDVEAEVYIKDCAEINYPSKVEKIVEAVFYFHEFNQNGYLPSQLKLIYSRVSQILGHNDELSNHDYNQISNDINNSTKQLFSGKLVQKQNWFRQFYKSITPEGPFSKLRSFVTSCLLKK